MSGRGADDDRQSVAGDDADGASGGSRTSGVNGDRAPSVSPASEDGVAPLVPYSPATIVAAITAVALFVRLVGLGARPFHYDEARVAYWSLHYLDTGSFTYRPIVHGPFIQLVNAWLFDLFGPSDFLARLPVAIVGGLLPATAFLYREHLRKSELAALALFLGFNAIFVYYSRFLRSDVLLATFVFAGFGFVVRYYDTRSVRYLYAAGFLVALGLTTKENGLVYLLTWVGATALLVDHALFPPRGFRTGVERIKQSWVGRRLGDAYALGKISFEGASSARGRWVETRRARRSVGRLGLHTVGVALLAFAVLVFFYADRGAGMAGIRHPPTPPELGSTGLWEALRRPLQFPGYALDTVQDAFSQALNQWGSVSDGDAQQSFLDRYISTLEEELTAIQNHALAIGVFGLFGFLWERYATRNPRNLVMFMSYCALASLFGYALKNDPGMGHWLTMHIVLPMTVPAAVGVARVYRWGRDAQVDRDTVGTFLAVFVILAVVLPAAFTTVETAYLDPTGEDNTLVQYAQPDAEMREVATAITTVSDGEGTDVLVYMHENHTTRYAILGYEPIKYRKPVCVGTSWTSTLPLPWYFETAGANVSCERSTGALEDRLQRDPPPMIVTKANDPTVPTERMSANYSALTVNFYRGAHAITVYVHEDHVDELPRWRASA